ncbi:MAG TPA: DegT/DnrJ/EryC1/StrS family aminotransferase, partial [Vicinamibacterales bacterium]|nr:DegT/DnrJ/EryC1/StrS family aminotransferase [Vicinamibacterales bacterium]
VGFKYHGNSIMAGIGLVGLKYLEQDNAYRRQLASWYDEALAGCAAIGRVEVAPDCESSRHLYQVMVDRRDEVMVALNREQIFPGVHYRDNSVYAMYRNQPDCPRARRASDRLISLPMHLRLDRADVHRVCAALIAAVR